MDWLSSKFSSPRPGEERGRGRDRDRDRRSRRDDSSSDEERGRSRRDRDRDWDRERFDDLDDEEEREERRRRRREREERRQREMEEDRAARGRMDERERERYERRDRERERDRRLRFEDKDEEEDRRRRAERERERKAEEDAREALRAENEQLTVSEPVAADDAFAEEQVSARPDGPKKQSFRYFGELDLRFNNDAVHIYWSALKALCYFAFFAYALSVESASITPAPCSAMRNSNWCLRDKGGSRLVPQPEGAPPVSVSYFCYQQDGDPGCATLCELTGWSRRDIFSAGCLYRMPPNPPALLPADVTASPALSQLRECVNKDEFKDWCTNVEGCMPEFVKDAQSGYQPAIAFLFLSMLLEIMFAGALFLWTAVHPDDFPAEMKNRSMRWPLYFAKSYPWLSQVLFAITAFCWVFLFISNSKGAEFCSQAQTQDGNPIGIFAETRAFLGAYACMVVVMLIIGSCIRKHKPVRGELYIPSFDDDVAPPCNLDFKDLRERPAPRLCPELWADCADPDSGWWCRPCATPCKHFWNFIFTVFFAPIGWLIENFFRHRHFIGP